MCASFRDVITSQRPCVQAQETSTSRSMEHVCKSKRRQHPVASNMCASARDVNIAGTMCASARDITIAQQRPCVQVKEMLSQVWTCVKSVPKHSRLRSTLNTNVITGLDMCKVCTEAYRLRSTLNTNVITGLDMCILKYVPKHNRFFSTHLFGQK